MNGKEFRAIRERLGFNEADFARELGYTGNGKNRVNIIKTFESGKKQIPLYIARLAWLIERALTSSVPINADWMVDWPEWPGYEFEEG